MEGERTDIGSQEGGASNSSVNLLEIEEGVFQSPLANLPRRSIAFETPRERVSPPLSLGSSLSTLGGHNSVPSSPRVSTPSYNSNNNSTEAVGGSVVHNTSNMAGTDPDTEKLKGYFVDNDPVEDTEFYQFEVVICKEDQGEPGSLEYCKAYQVITAPLEEKFGAAKHFIVSSRDGESDSGNTKYRNVQEQFVGNYDKLAGAEKHCIAYDLMEVLDIPNYRDRDATHPSRKWGTQTSNLFKHFSSFELDQVKDWQHDSNRYGGGDH